MATLFSRLRRLLSLQHVRDTVRGVSQRELQQRIDVHKLYLYTSLHEHCQQLPPGSAVPATLAEQIVQEASKLAFVEQAAAVQRHVEAQALHIARFCDQALVQAGDRRPAASALQQLVAQQQQRAVWQQRLEEGKMAGTGLTAWMSSQAAPATPASHTSSSSQAHSTSSSEQGVSAAEGVQPPVKAAARVLLDQQQLSQLLQQQLGHSLAVGPSCILHKEAGLGLFLQGSCRPGALLALFPGLVYPRSSYRHMPGFPKPDRSNPYLTSRWDAAVVDSKPWGQGWQPQTSSTPQASCEHESPAATHSTQFTTKSSSSMDSSQGSGSLTPSGGLPTDKGWVTQTSSAAAHLELLEGRHPLALAHFANHPAAGMQPNVMIVSFTVNFLSAACDEDAAALRAYIPNMFWSEQVDRQQLLQEEVPCVGLVALAPLAEGQELLFNYRLSPGLLGRPDWYVSVDEQEDDRRWG